MKDTNLAGWLIIGAIALAITLVLSYVVFRWIFSIEKQLHNQQRQITILKLIAMKLGVDEKDFPVDIKK